MVVGTTSRVLFDPSEDAPPALSAMRASGLHSYNSLNWFLPELGSAGLINVPFWTKQEWKSTNEDPEHLEKTNHGMVCMEIKLLFRTRSYMLRSSLAGSPLTLLIREVEALSQR